MPIDVGDNVAGRSVGGDAHALAEPKLSIERERRPGKSAIIIFSRLKRRFDETKKTRKTATQKLEFHDPMAMYIDV
jgi:hypothetical protein